MNFAVSADHRVKIKDKQILGSCQKAKKLRLWNGPQMVRKETVGTDDPKKNQDHPGFSTFKIGLNT